jgi:hypothetical protein
MHLPTQKNLGAWKRLSESNELLKSVIAEAYVLNGCKVDADYYCGALAEFSEENTVLWSFGRLGWREAGAGYRTFLTFTNPGTGRHTKMALDADSSVSVEAKRHPPADSVPYEFIRHRVNVEFHRVRIYDYYGDIDRVVELK